MDQQSIDKQSIEDLVYGATLSHLAVENRDIKFLTNVNKEDLLIKDRDGETPLHYAALNDDLEICKLLILRNPELINIKDIENKTAYDWSYEYNLEYNSHIDIINELKQYL
jgi:ankyrin repeat protein